MWRWCAIWIVGCGAQVPTQRTTDAASDARPIDAPVDQPIDARACVGGNAQMTAADGSCLLRFDTPLDFESAQAQCQAIGTNLAIVTNAEREAAVAQLAGAGQAFIGLTDVVSEMTFVWVDNTPIAFQDFAAMEPNNANGAFEEDCVIYDGTRPGWDDRPCVAGGVAPGEYPYICMF